jgi:hypothetical protein
VVAQPDPVAIRAAAIVSLQSVLWTLVTGSGAFAIGIARGSTALAAFGSVGFVDAIGSAALVHHFRHGHRNEVLAAHLERVAHRIVVVGLVAVGFGAIVTGGFRLAGDATIGVSGVGAVLAAVSLVVLTGLARRRAPTPRPASRVRHCAATGTSLPSAPRKLLSPCSGS